MRNHRKRKLSRSMLAAIMAFALVLFLSVTLFLGFNYYYTEMNNLSNEAFAYARSASRFIDGDKVEGYLENQIVNSDGSVTYTTDEYYDEVKDYLTSVHKEHEMMKYYYVFIPNEDTVTYVWDAETDDPSQLGDTEGYMDGGKEAVARIYNDHPVERLQTYKDETWGNIACAFYPVYNSAGKPVAVVGVDLSMENIRSAFLNYLYTIIIVITIVLVIASIVFYLQIRRRLVKPINKLNKATQKLVQKLDSDEEFKMDIHTRDELEDLANSFAVMDTDLKNYIKRLSAITAEKERIGAELNVATQIQADMLPRIFPAFPGRSEFDIYATMTPAKEVGGDFYDFFLVDDDHIALVMADVSGKGVPAALFMVIAKTLIKNHAQAGESPSEILRNVNEQLCEGNEAELFVTVWLAIIEISTGKGVAANAGHEHPALRRAGGRYELAVYRHSPAVATMEGMRFREHEFKLDPGDSLFVYTDGVPEATDADLQLFKTERMLTALNREPSASPDKLLKNVRDDINAFVGDADQFDDITMLGFSYFGSKEEETPDELTLDAADENVGTVLAFIDEHLEKENCNPKTQMQIDVAVEELFVNIAHYAYAPEVGKATIRFERKADPDRVVITFIDSGKPFDPLAKPDPDITLPADERPIGGLGIYLVKKSVDQFSYERKDEKNILFIEKIIK